MTVSRKMAKYNMLHGNSVCLIIAIIMSKAKQLQKALTISAGADPGFHPRGGRKVLGMEIYFNCIRL